MPAGASQTVVDWNLRAVGENITRRIDLPALPQGTLPRIGDTVVEVTGLRTPFSKIERFRKELRRAVTEHRQLGTVGSGHRLDGGVVIRDDRIGVIIPRRPDCTASSSFSPRLSAFASIEIFHCLLPLTSLPTAA